MPKKTPHLKRFLQLVTGVHRIHHIRYSFGYKLPFVGWAYFPTWTAPGGGKRYEHGWQRVVSRDFHDCTTTGRY